MAAMMRMQLSLLILSLQLAQIASAGDKARHSENDGLGRRQAKSSLQAGQVVRGNRIRARLGSRLLERDFEQEDRREEGDVVTPGTIESSRGIRKGVRKAHKKNNKNTKKILTRLDIAETVQVNKESKQSEQVEERRILKRKKERNIVKADVGLEKGSNKTLQAINTRFRNRQLYRRKPVLSQAKQEMPVETTTMVQKTTTTVNPVLIWRQQAAVAEQEPRISGSGRRAGGGRGRSRRRKIKRNKSGYTMDTLEKSEVPQIQLNVALDLHRRVSFPKRIKTVQPQEEREVGYNMKDKETPNISFESNNIISTESKYQTETKRRPGRRGSNLSQQINTPISRGDLDQNSEENKSGKVGSFPFKKRLSNLRHTVSASRKLKPVLIEKIVNEEDRKAAQRPTLNKSKSVKIHKRIPSNSTSSVTTSVTSTSYSVTDSETDAKKVSDNEERKDDKTEEDNIEHRSQLKSRRKGQLPLRKSNDEQTSAKGNTIRSNKTTGTKVDQRLKLRIDPRIRNRGRALQKDSYKANDESIKNSPRVIIVTKSKKKGEEPNKTKLNTPEEKDANIIHLQLNGPAGLENKSTAIIQGTKGFSHLKGKDANVREQFKEEKGVGKEILRGKHQPILNENISENYQFRLKNGKNKYLLQEKAVVQKASAKPNRISTSRQNHRPLSKDKNISRSETSTARVDQRLRLRFDPRRRNTLKLPHKISENLDIAKSTKVKTDLSSNVIKIKASRKTENIRPKIVVRKKTKSGSGLRRGGIPPRQRDNLESIIMAEQNNRKPKPGGPRTVAHRRRQQFDPRNKQQLDEDSKGVGSNIKAKSKEETRDIPTVPITASAAPDKYLDIACAHAEITWAQDPFRAGSADVEGPQFDIDYTKDPNYNSEDNKGPVEIFANFGTEEGSLGTVPEQLENIKHTNLIPDSFSFVPSIQRTRQKQQGTETKDEPSLHHFEAKSRDHFGSFSDPDPVFVPLFVPDLRKQDQAGGQQFFQPVSFSVDF